MSLRIYLAFFGIFDVLFSLTILCLAVIYVANCKTDDAISFITPSTTVEQWKFFTDAYKSCNYQDENSIPPSGVICKQLEREVLPLVIISTSLNFLSGVLIQIIVRDKYFLVDDKKGTRELSHTRFQSLGIVPFGILLEMCFTLAALMQYSNVRFCWLSYSIEDMTESSTRPAMIITGALLLTIYKPTELAIYFFYASRLVETCDELGQRNSATYDLASQLKSEPSIERPPKNETKPEKRIKRVTLDEANGIPVLKYSSSDEDRQENIKQ